MSIRISLLFLAVCVAYTASAIVSDLDLGEVQVAKRQSHDFVSDCFRPPEPPNWKKCHCECCPIIWFWCYTGKINKKFVRCDCDDCDCKGPPGSVTSP